jgi:hypothetical protein
MDVLQYIIGQVRAVSPLCAMSRSIEEANLPGGSARRSPMLGFGVGPLRRTLRQSDPFGTRAATWTAAALNLS